MRDKLQQYNTIADALKLIQNSKRVLILTGAGISQLVPLISRCHCPTNILGVSCGIPDFRSRDGLYALIKTRGDFDLDDPQQMCESYHYCCRNLSYFSICPAGLISSFSERTLLVRLAHYHKDLTWNIFTVF